MRVQTIKESEENRNTFFVLFYNADNKLWDPKIYKIDMGNDSKYQYDVDRQFFFFGIKPNS